MTATTEARTRSGRLMLNKVPEVTIWFWVIKILCTTVGESFADWINMKLGVGLVNTAWIFTAVFVVVLAVQLRLKWYVPFPYWLTVVVVSVTGTLYTDILTDQLNVPLWISSAVFSVLLAAVFGVWWARERTLSIHSVTTLPRESFYWLAVLVTFALGTATGDWTLELTGWSPGASVLLPLGLIAAITALWKFGANPVLSFWLAYILTRPLGANIGDWLASPKVAQPGEPTGLDLGTFTTSLIFLGLILATVIYLTVTRSDVTETHEATHAAHTTGGRGPRKERVALAGFGLLAVATAGLLVWAHSQPHVGPAPEEDNTSAVQMAPGQAVKKFPPAEVAALKTLASTSLKDARSGNETGAHAAAQKLRDLWDADQASLQPLDQTGWTSIDAQMDKMLKTFGIDHSNPPMSPAQQEKELNALLTDMG
ncbi:COG4705 family protein [Streptomyces longwoodensis]|uniref:COG4705 family protein n=1 Tax=Streptomyces longwoodensis TaxID=68231 RepID=UPI0033C71E64